MSPTTRRAFVAASALALAGCSGDSDGTTDTPVGTTTPTETDNPAISAVQQQGDLGLTSSAFADGEAIPDRYSRDGENINPPLSVENAPSEAATLTLIVDDPDAVEVAGEVFLHWLVWNSPAETTDIPAGWEPGDAVVGPNDFGNRRYDGPAPPDSEHTYRFKLYALDTSLALPASAEKTTVGEAMQDHVLAQTQLTGTYAP